MKNRTIPVEKFLYEQENDNWFEIDDWFRGYLSMPKSTLYYFSYEANHKNTQN